MFCRSTQTAHSKSDHLGSTRVITGVNGSVTDSYDYMPFGEQFSLGTGTVPSRFTGDDYDSESNLYHALARQYPATQGRWLSPDPLGGSIANPQSLNRYSYVRNSPLGLIDPLGLTPTCMLASKDPGAGTGSAGSSGSPGGPSADDSGDGGGEDPSPAPQGLTCVQIVQRGLMQVCGGGGGCPGYDPNGGGGGDTILDGVSLNDALGPLQNGDTDPSDHSLTSTFANPNSSVTCPAAPGCGDTAGWATGGRYGTGQWMMAAYDCSSGSKAQCGYLTPWAAYDLGNSPAPPTPAPWLHSGNVSPIDFSQFAAAQLLLLTPADMAFQTSANNARKPQIAGPYVASPPVPQPPTRPTLQPPRRSPVPLPVMFPAGGVPF